MGGGGGRGGGGGGWRRGAPVAGVGVGRRDGGNNGRIRKREREELGGCEDKEERGGKGERRAGRLGV